MEKMAAKKPQIAKNPEEVLTRARATVQTDVQSFPKSDNAFQAESKTSEPPSANF
jgi:hypothetical protein